ncbi:MAG: hypothetical protein ACOYUZ_02095 [Patescibacteria group bacterium]
MADIYIITHTIGRYGLIYTKSLPDIKRFLVDPAADPELVCKFLKLFGILKENEGYDQIPQKLFAKVPDDGVFMAAKLRTHELTGVMLVTFWQIIDEDQNQLAFDQLKKYSAVRD